MKELIGKKIKSAVIIGHSLGCDSENVLVLKMTDGSIFHITGGYGGYTGKSCDEYIETIAVEQVSPSPIKTNK